MNIILHWFIIGITLTCLGYNTVTDIRSHQTNTVSIYFCCLIVGLIQLYLLYPDSLLMLNYMASILFTVLILAGIKHLLGDRVGGGDYDIVLLLYLASGWPGICSVLIASGMAILVVTLPLLITKVITRKTRWPCVPFFLVGYLTYLALGVIG